MQFHRFLGSLPMALLCSSNDCLGCGSGPHLNTKAYPFSSAQISTSITLAQLKTGAFLVDYIGILGAILLLGWTFARKRPAPPAAF